MNYGKKKAAKSARNRLRPKSAMQGKRVGVRLFKALLICASFVAAVAGVAGGGLFIKKIIDDSPDVSAC